MTFRAETSDSENPLASSLLNGQFDGAMSAIDTVKSYLYTHAKSRREDAVCQHGSGLRACLQAAPQRRLPGMLRFSLLSQSISLVLDHSCVHILCAAPTICRNPSSLLQELRCSHVKLTCLRLSPDGNQLFAGGLDGSVYVFDVKDKDPSRSVAAGRRCPCAPPQAMNWKLRGSMAW